MFERTNKKKVHGHANTLKVIRKKKNKALKYFKKYIIESLT